MKQNRFSWKTLSEKQPWINGEYISEECDTFVYLIYNTKNNDKYIGKKQKITLRNVAEKGATRKKWEKRETWKDYWGSNYELTEHIKQEPDIWRRKIVMTFTGKKASTYFEGYLQLINDVINSPDYYNDNLFGKFFGRDKLEEKILFQDDSITEIKI